jgi:hypothetical protein
MPIGQLRLPVTFGTRDNYRTESLDFDVAYIALPYNAILGYPALARFMATTHDEDIPSIDTTAAPTAEHIQELHPPNRHIKISSKNRTPSPYQVVLDFRLLGEIYCFHSLDCICVHTYKP